MSQFNRLTSDLKYLTLKTTAQLMMNYQCNTLATRAISSVVDALQNEPPEVQGFEVKNRYYELVYKNDNGKFELTVSLNWVGVARFYLVTDKYYKGTSKKVLRELTQHDAALALADFYKIR